MQYSIVNFKIVRESEEFRWDSDYFRPENIALDNILRNMPTINDISRTVDLQSNGSFKVIFSILNDDNEKVVPYIRSNNVGSFFIVKEGLEFISKEAHLRLPKTHTKEGDILLARKGKIGGAAIVTEDCVDFNTNDNIVNIRVTHNSLIPEYLVAFLNSVYGYQQIRRQATGNVQPWLSMYQVRNLRVYISPIQFQKKIRDLVHLAYIKKQSHISLYHQAQSLLLSELGLLDWKPKHQLTFVKNFSDTQKAGRIDAEYFQPKYDEIVEAIKSYSVGWDTLGNLVSVKKCVEVGSDEYLDEGIPFIRVSNLSPFEITEEKYISEELYSKLSKHQPQKGEILLSKDATPGIAHYVNEEPKKMIPSGGILRLKKIDERINEEYLTTVLNSLIVQEQIKRDVGGSVILHWRPDQVKRTLIPILADSIQEKIKQKITESFNLRKQSKHLLECAKKAVEMAIEEDEDAAMGWLNKEVGGLDA